MSAPDPTVIPGQRQSSETITPEPRTYIARTPSGGRLLVTVHEDTVEVAMRLGDRWSPPFNIEQAS